MCPGGGRNPILHQPGLDAGALGACQVGLQVAGDEPLVDVQPEDAARVTQGLLDDQGSGKHKTAARANKNKEGCVRF